MDWLPSSLEELDLSGFFRFFIPEHPPSFGLSEELVEFDWEGELRKLASKGISSLGGTVKSIRVVLRTSILLSPMKLLVKHGE